MIWFWGTGGAGIRLADRFAAVLSTMIPPGHVSIFGHADNGLLRQARERGNAVLAVPGAAGHRRKFGLATQAIPRALHLWRHLRRERPDAIIIPMNFALAWPLAFLAIRLGIPYAYMVHDAVPHPGDFAPLWQTNTQRRLLANARCILAPSMFTAAEVRRRLPPKSAVHVLPLATLVPQRRTAPRSEPRLPVRFLFLGRLIAYKGLELLSEAFRPLAERPEWRLTIAGTGPEEDKVRRWFSGMAQVDMSELKALPEEAIERLISAHDVLICPYTEASQSGVIAEAAADGMPCIVTPVGALPEQVGEGRCGWVAEGVRPQDLGKVVEAILRHPDEIRTKSQRIVELAAQQSADRPLQTVLRALVGMGEIHTKG